MVDESADGQVCRRRYLLGVGAATAGLLAGCTGETIAPGEGGGEPVTSPPTRTPTEEQNRETATTTPTGEETGERTPTGTPTETPTPTPTTPGDPIPERPDPTYVVAKDGSGDYDSFQKAHRVAQNGDTIRLKAGDYRGTVSKDLHFLGAGPERTRFTVVPADGRVKDLPGRHDFWDMTLDVAGRNRLYESTTYHDELRFGFYNSVVRPGLPGTVKGKDTDVVSEAPVHAVESTFERSVRQRKLNVSRSQFEQNLAGVGKLYSTTVGGTLNVSGGKIVDSAIGGQLRAIEGGSLRIENSRLNGGFLNDARVEDRSKTNAVPPKVTVRNSVLKASEAVGAAVRTHSKKFDIADSRVTARNTSGTNTAIRVTASISAKRCKLEGKCGGSYEANYVGNVFEADGSFDYFIDAKRVELVALNAFRGADVRIDKEGQMYDPDRKLGNYYSEWGKSTDEDGDGVVDLPRPIPGNAKLTDQYPLVRPEPGSYTN